MPELKLICPSCQHRYNVKVADIVTVKTSSFNCKKCETKIIFEIKTGHIISHEKSAVAVPGSVPNQPMVQEQKFDPNKTYIPIGNSSQALPGKLIVHTISAGRTELALVVGINTVGRLSESSRSTIKVDVNDAYMSRNHFMIEVILKNNQVFHVLSDNDSKGGTVMNERLLARGESVRLNNGDKILAGDTVFIFSHHQMAGSPPPAHRPDEHTHFK